MDRITTLVTMQLVKSYGYIKEQKVSGLGICPLPHIFPFLLVFTSFIYLLPHALPSPPPVNFHLVV